VAGGDSSKRRSICQVGSKHGCGSGGADWLDRRGKRRKKRTIPPSVERTGLGAGPSRAYGAKQAERKFLILLYGKGIEVTSVTTDQRGKKNGGALRGQ